MYAGVGGGIFMNGGSLNMIGGVIGGRTSEPDSGYAKWDGTPQYADGEAGGNRAGNAGGIYITSTTGMVTVALSAGALIQFNKQEYGSAAMGGGGVYISNNATVSLNSGAKISYNYAAQDGGGVFALNNTATVTINAGCEISYNNANYGGGAYPQKGATLFLNGGSIINNYARQNGGGVMSGVAASFYMNSGIIAGNATPENRVGGGYCGKSTDTFIKTGGVIYGIDGGPNRNISGSGSAAFIIAPVTSSETAISWDFTLDSTPSGNYEYPPPSP
jgi:hypothetical protein